MKTLIEQIAPFFTELDINVRQRQMDWAFARVAAIKKYKEENRPNRLGDWNYYKGLFDVAGGKTWYLLLNGRTDEQVRDIVNKNIDAMIEKRNQTIVNKLVKHCVTKIEGVGTIHSDGFEGRYVATTNQGKKGIRIKIIVAGGYNIQCLHQRCLVHVR